MVATSSARSSALSRGACMFMRRQWLRRKREADAVRCRSADGLVTKRCVSSRRRARSCSDVKVRAHREAAVAGIGELSPSITD